MFGETADLLNTHFPAKKKGKKKWHKQ
jgi:hypothetical protein